VGSAWFTRVDSWWARGVRRLVLSTVVTNDPRCRREAALQCPTGREHLFGWASIVRRILACTWCGKGAIPLRILQDESERRVDFQLAGVGSSLQWIAETYTREVGGNACDGIVAAWTDTGNNEAFLAGILAMTQNAEWNDVCQGRFSTVCRSPTKSSCRIHCGSPDNQPVDQLGGVLSTSSGTKNQAAAEDLIRHLTSEPVQQRVWGNLSAPTPCLPTEWLDRSAHYRNPQLHLGRAGGFGKRVHRAPLAQSAVTVDAVVVDSARSTWWPEKCSGDDRREVVENTTTRWVMLTAGLRTARQ